ncbi:MAG: AAA family ATPase [bacterium]
MKIAIAGKGGSGKTTLAGTLARLQARQQNQDLVAIDGDSNPNLALTLGLPREQHKEIRPMPRSVIERVTNEEGKARLQLAKKPDEIIHEYGIDTPDGVKLLLMAAVDHAGAG